MVETGVNFVILDVNGVGYSIYTISPEKHLLDTLAYFHTHLAVRENALDLYGFTDRDTLEFFELLIALPKIGPKSALQILNQAEISLIKEAVINNDPAHLSKLSGIGKKSAEKIVLGLKDKLDNLEYHLTTNTAGLTTAGPTHIVDTIDVLITLGYSQSDVRKAVQRLATERPEITKVNDAVKEILKMLG